MAEKAIAFIASLVSPLNNDQLGTRYLMTAEIINE